MFIKPSFVLAAAVLTAASFLARSTANAEDSTYLMPTGRGGGHTDDGIQPFDPNPAARGSNTRQFLTYGMDEDGNAIPVKTLRITNNTANTVYPIMRDPNSKLLVTDPGRGLYDPYDLPDKEYRGYIGYEKDGQFYFGLKRNESILVSVPLVFWNGARIGIGTDGKYLSPTGDPNPLRYRPTAHRSITNAQTSEHTPTMPIMSCFNAIAGAPAASSADCGPPHPARPTHANRPSRRHGVMASVPGPDGRARGLRRTAALPVAADKPRSDADRQACNDTRSYCQHARGSPRRGIHRRRTSAGNGTNQICTRHDHHP